MHPILNIAIQAARLAGEVIVRNMEYLDRVKISTKSDSEYVSEVDIKAEQAIISVIKKAYPEHGIIAEESGSSHEDAESVWIIDPLDGTTNYLQNFPFFAISIAYSVKKRIEHAVVYDPLRHEFFTASRGGGAKLNDRRIRVSKKHQLKDALLGTGIPLRNVAVAQKYLPTLNAFSGKCAGIRRTGSAALDLAYVACGRLDGFWEFGLRPWDIAAGGLLIKEAGGLVSDMEGREDYLAKGNVVAGAPKIFKSILQLLHNSN